jgi:hypothetical protein
MTSIVAAEVFTVSLAFDRVPPGLAVSDDALHPGKLCVVTAASSHVRLRLGVRRPRPPRRAESIGRAWALRAYSSRPARSRFQSGRAPLLRFRVPFSTRRPRRALSPKAAGLRTCPAPAFGARFSPALACHGPDDQQTRRPCGFPLYQRGHCGVARSGGRFGAESCGPASFSRVACDALHDEQNRVDSISRRLWSVARVRSVKPTRLMIFPHARGGPADRAALCPTPP